MFDCWDDLAALNRDIGREMKSQDSELQLRHGLFELSGEILPAAEITTIKITKLCD